MIDPISGLEERTSRLARAMAAVVVMASSSPVRSSSKSDIAMGGKRRTGVSVEAGERIDVGSC